MTLCSQLRQKISIWIKTLLKKKLIDITNYKARIAIQEETNEISGSGMILLIAYGIIYLQFGYKYNAYLVMYEDLYTLIREIKKP